MGWQAEVADGAGSIGTRIAYMPQLDGLRFVAIAMVVAEHTFPAVDGLQLGFLGVRLFFVLSGFLITGILIAEADRPGTKFRGIRDFYLRRALRIFPIYYLMIGFLCALDVGETRATVGWHALFLTNECLARTGFVNAPLNHFWSLAVEEQFYLLWPWIVFWLPRRYLAAVCAAFVLVAPLSRAQGTWEGLPYMTVSYPLSACTDSLGWGALLAICRIRGEASFKRCIDFCGLVGVPLAAVLYTWGFHRRETAVYIGGFDFAWAMVAAWLVGRSAIGFRGTFGTLLVWPPVAYLGRISYGLYVYHFLAIVTQPVVAFGLERSPENMLWSRWVAVASLIGMASLSWYAFERPINRLKDRFGSTR